ncbi:hypothetical protein LE197_11675 [Pseudomonas sp. PS1(2021)]|nr:hypothetical protein LE197_11675 [Pseudomonas sp. PS1(2021)]
MARRKDDRTLDIFDVPQPARAIPGECNYAAQVSELVSEILKAANLDRYEIAARMSRLSGDDVSKNMLDAWSSPARVDHNLPFYRAALLEDVCASHLLTNWLVDVRGGRVAYGRDALLAELGRLERTREEAGRQARELKRILGSRDDKHRPQTAARQPAERYRVLEPGQRGQRYGRKHRSQPLLPGRTRLARIGGLGPR